MRLAVVILNWNGKKHLKTFLPSVIQHSSTYADIYVADNASTDDSVAYVRSEFPTIKIVQNSSNDGFAKGYNLALNKIQAEYYILLNSDVEVSANWIAPLLELMDSDNEIGICQPKILSYRQKDRFEYAGAAGGFIDVLGYPFCRGRIFQEMESDNGQYDQSSEIFWASGACMLIKAELFHSLNGFDERYFAHMEEIDLCWRAKNLGNKVFYQPRSVVYHLGGGTMANSNPRKTFLNFRNSLMTLYKNDNSPYTFFKILSRLLLDALAFVKLLIDSNPSHAFSVIKAHFDFYSMKKPRMKKTVKSTFGIYNGSIVLEHYLLGKSKFSQLKKSFSRSVK